MTVPPLSLALHVMGVTPETVEPAVGDVTVEVGAVKSLSNVTFAAAEVVTLFHVS